MFRKLFIYSVQERKRNNIHGLFGEIIEFIICLPVIGLITSLISYLYRPMTSTELTVTFSVTVVALLFVLIFKIIRYTIENVTTFAIDEEGKLVVLNMSKSAASYLDLQSAIQNMNSGENSKLKGMFAAGGILNNAIGNIEADDQTERNLVVRKKVNKVERVEFKRKKIIISGDISGKKKLVIRRVYNDMNVLEEYLRMVESGEDTDKFSFYRNVTEQDYVVTNKKGLLEYSLRWGIFVLWFVVLTLSTDINTYARIRHNEYISSDAVIKSIEGDKGNYNVLVSYEADGQREESTFSSSEKKYDDNTKIKIYYSRGNTKKIMPASDVGFHIKPYCVIWIFGQGIIAFIYFSRKR